MDCDAFFVQVARLEDPDGAGRAELLVVGGSADGRGVVTSASYEARRYGVRSAMPTAQALRLCPGATVVPVPRAACVRRSREVAATLRALAPVVQAASIDEFYLDLGGTERLLAGEDLEATARRIREEVLQRTEISVSVGGGARRLIAKLAAGVAKPGGVRVVPPGEEAAFLGRFELGELPGVGPSLAEALRRRGLVRVEDVLPLTEDWLTAWLGETRGRWLWERVRGIDPTPVLDREPRKSISCERTFAEDLRGDEDVDAALLRLVVSVAGSLRASGLRARTVTVKVRDPDFTTRQGGRTVPEAVESDAAIFALARPLLRELRSRRRLDVRLLGVALSGLVDAVAPEQVGLFGDAGLESGRDRALSRAVDGVRERFGEDALLPGRLAGERQGRRRGGSSRKADP